MAQSDETKINRGGAWRRCVLGLHCLPGKGLRRIGYFPALLVCFAGSANAQPALVCDVSALEQAIEQHNEQVFRLTTKFKDIWYPQGPIPAEVRKAVTLKNIKRYLASLGERKT